MSWLAWWLSWVTSLLPWVTSRLASWLPWMTNWLAGWLPWATYRLASWLPWITNWLASWLPWITSRLASWLPWVTSCCYGERLSFHKTTAGSPLLLLPLNLTSSLFMCECKDDKSGGHEKNECNVIYLDASSCQKCKRSFYVIVWSLHVRSFLVTIF